MYELNNKVRLIDVSSFPIRNSDEFIGFVCGIISQDHDLEEMYLDSFLNVAKLEDQDISEAVAKLEEIGKLFEVTFTLSVSLDENELPDGLKDKVIASL